MNKINNKIPWGLAIGTLGVTIAGAFNGPCNNRTGKHNWRSISVSDRTFDKTTKGEDKAQSRVGNGAKIA